MGVAWFALGVGGILFRMVHLFFIYNVRMGVAWAVKIITDPFYDTLLYWRSPFFLMGGQLIDPMDDVRHGHGPTELADMEEDEEGFTESVS